MVARKTANGRNGNGKARRSRANTELDLTTFNNRRRMKIAIEKTLTIPGSAGPTIDIYQVGINSVGLTQNRLAQRLFTTDGLGGSWHIEHVRIRAIDVVFDARGIGASVVFNQRARVGAWVTPDAAAAIDGTELVKEIGMYTPHAVNPNLTRIVRLRMGPEFTLGRFGGARTAMSLIIAGDGFQGSIRIFYHLETTGFPGARLTLANDIMVEESQPKEVHFSSDGKGNIIRSVECNNSSTVECKHEICQKLRSGSTALTGAWSETGDE
jgi:hypothetical protein